MSKVKYVTGNIHKIGDLSPEQPEGTGENPHNREEVTEGGNPPRKRQRLSPATEEALQRRHEEFLRFRKDILFRMEELSCGVKNAHENGERLLRETTLLEEEIQKCRKQLDECGEPDTDDPRYQVILAEKCRLLDLMRLTIIQLESRLEKSGFSLSGGKNASENETNLFAQMDSLTGRQLLRLGFWIFFPGMLIMFLSAVTVGLLVLATFRIGL